MSLAAAIEQGDVQTCQQLLASGADVKAKDAHGWTPLHFAANNTSEHAVKMVGFMLAHCADVHGKTMNGWTPLHIAAKNTSDHAVMMVDVMLAHGADMHVKNNEGCTPLHIAAKNTSDYAVMMVDVMLARCADVHVTNNEGHTAFDIARDKGRHAVVSLLTRWSLSLAELAGEGGTVALRRKLDTGADVNEPCPDGSTALHHAVRGDHVAAARLLLQRGADPLRADGNGRRPCDVAGPACTEVLVTLAVEELEEVEGVGGLKETLLGIVQQVQVRRIEGRDTAGLLSNYLFYGSAGTGKRTGARMLARVLHAFGLLTKNHVEERSAEGLTGEYVGQSKARVEEAMKAARGGVLFVDEAYMLGGDPCGDRAMAKLLSMMREDGYRDSTVVVMAGDRDRMRGLLQRNEGLRSRFTKTVHFPDWLPAQCTRFVQKPADGAKPRFFSIRPR